ncbi:ML domain-containing protein [Crucibulum laeve]|uniref:Phosphatidylglycerol/phosphatidylinositol transfer protein n=1 Tax=Crucibulum laeve TaxID=68775 RepID=A0A5C3M6X6_9AGAR|nr:ML domain-containing protein [Crucibulum laeve]
MRPSAYLSVLVLGLASLVAAKPFDGQVPLQSDGTVHTTDGWDYEICSGPEATVQIESIEVSPDPPKPGQDLTVKVKGTALGVIEDGAYADVVVKLGLIKLLQKQFDICEEARNANASVQCPVEQGTYTVQQTVALPKEIPKAKFTINVDGFTKDDEELLCLKLHVNFMKNPFPRLW